MLLLKWAINNKIEVAGENNFSQEQSAGRPFSNVANGNGTNQLKIK